MNTDKIKMNASRVPFHFGSGPGALTPDNSRGQRKLTFASGSATSLDPN